MKPVERFHLGAPDPAGEASPLLDSDGSVVGLVDGGVLDAQFEVSDGYLVVTEDEDPFENCLHFSLFTRESKKLDSVSLGIPYQGGTLRLRQTGPADDLQFSFFADELWQLEVRPRPRLVLGRPFGPVRYPGGLRHRLILSKVDA